MSQPPSSLKSGFDLTGNLTLQDKVALATLFAPFIEEVCKSALIYTAHHSTPGAYPMVVGRDSMIKAMKYHFLDPEGAAHRIQPQITAFLSRISSPDELLEDEDMSFAEAPEEEPSSDETPLSAESRQSVSAHFQPTLQAALESNSGSQNRAIVQGLMQSVMGPVQVEIDQDTSEGEEEETAIDEETKEVEADPQGVCCEMCQKMDAVDDQWTDWTPTEPWHIVARASLEKAFGEDSSSTE